MPALQEILMASSIVVSICVLIYASWKDYQSREVSNMVWIVWAPIALVLTLPQILLYNQVNLLFFGISVGVTFGLALLLFYAGGFGGADSKALMCIALALPFAPLLLVQPLIMPASPTSQMIFPITIFGNAVLFAAASCIYMLLRNLIWRQKTKAQLFAGLLASESWSKKLLVLITGYKMNIEKVKAKWHIFPLEDINDSYVDLPRKLVVVPKEEGREQILQRLSDAVDQGKIDSYILATPGLPMLIFVTLGLVVAVFGGDLVWLLVRTVVGA